MIAKGPVTAKGWAVQAAAGSGTGRPTGGVVGSLDGKGALVTGGSRGIGAAIVKRLAADGATVVFSYVRHEAAAQEVVDEIAEADGNAFAVQADQGSMGDLNRLFTEVDKRLDGLDIVVCNAAEAMPAPIDDVTEQTYDRYMAVNAKGPFFIIQYAGRKLRNDGRIIAISTANTRMHSPLGVLYTGGKGALENFTKVAALAFGARGITANIVSPGATDTDGLRNANPGDTFEDTIKLTALQRLGRPEDVASVVAMLAGPDAAWISGQNILADGGLWP
jgi:3-oxoacyl-[acyl-carrier protein] reductase